MSANGVIGFAIGAIICAIFLIIRDMMQKTNGSETK